MDDTHTHTQPAHETSGNRENTHFIFYRILKICECHGVMRIVLTDDSADIVELFVSTKHEELHQFLTFIEN